MVLWPLALVLYPFLLLPRMRLYHERLYSLSVLNSAGHSRYNEYTMSEWLQLPAMSADGFAQLLETFARARGLQVEAIEPTPFGLARVDSTLRKPSGMFLLSRPQQPTAFTVQRSFRDASAPADEGDDDPRHYYVDVQRIPVEFEVPVFGKPTRVLSFHQREQWELMPSGAGVGFGEQPIGSASEVVVHTDDSILAEFVTGLRALASRSSLA